MSFETNPKHHQHKPHESEQPRHGTSHESLAFHSQMHKMSTQEHRALYAHIKHGPHNNHVLHDFHIHDRATHLHYTHVVHHPESHKTLPEREEHALPKPVITDATRSPLIPHDYQPPPGFALKFGADAQSSRNSDAKKTDESPAIPLSVPATTQLDKLPGATSDPKMTIVPANDLPDRLMKAVSLNEGTFTSVTRNDQHHGLSVGIRQWNQKGELPLLLHDWHEKNPAKFDEIFGKYKTDAVNPSWIYHARHLGYDKNFMEKMNTALSDPEFQQVQMDNSKQFARQAVDRAKSLGLHSELGAAIVADFQNQMGQSGSGYAFRRAGLREGAEVKNETEVLKKLGKITRRPNGKARMDELTNIFSPLRMIDGPPVTPNV